MPPEQVWFLRHFSESLNCEPLHPNLVFFYISPSLFPFNAHYLCIQLILNKQKVAEKQRVKS